MTMHKCKRVASAIRQIVKAELPDAWLRARHRSGIRRLAAQAQQMGLAPGDVLTDNGRDAFTSIARAIFTTASPSRSADVLGAEWQLIVQLAEPALPFEREALAS